MTLNYAKTALVSRQIVISYWLKNFGSNPGSGNRFFFSPKRPDRLWSPPSLLLYEYQGHFPDVMRPGSEFYHLLPTTAEGKKEWSCTFLRWCRWKWSLRHEYADAQLLGSCVRIPLTAWGLSSVFVVCYTCDKLETYRDLCVTNKGREKSLYSPCMLAWRGQWKYTFYIYVDPIILLHVVFWQ